LTGKTGENFPPDGTVQFFLQKSGTGAVVPFDNVYFFSWEKFKELVCQSPTLKPQTNKFRKKGLQ